MARPANRSCGLWMRQLLLLKCTTCLEQASIERLTGDRFVFIIGLFTHRPTCDLLCAAVAPGTTIAPTSRLIVGAATGLQERVN